MADLAVDETLEQVSFAKAHARLRDFVYQIFDAEFYLGHYPDLNIGVSRALSTGGRHVVRMYSSEDSPGAEPIEHYFNYGMSEGRSPSLAFDLPFVHGRLAKYGLDSVPPGEVVAYFANLPDERRFVPNPWFSPWAVRKLYGDTFPELLDASDYKVFEFYVEQASFLGLSPNGVFREESYRLRYPDVATAVGRAQFHDGLTHFALHGFKDGRVNLPGTVASIQPNAGVPELPWLLSGSSSMDRVVWWFDEAFYLGVYPDVHDLVRRSIVKSGLEHYLVAGYAEERLPSPWLLGSLPAAADPDPWLHFEGLPLPRQLPAPGCISLQEAASVKRWLAGQPFAGDATQVDGALWPFVRPPVIDGTLAVPEYLAANADIAAANVGAPVAEVERHWREYGAQEHRSAPGSNVFGKRAITVEDLLKWRSGVNYFGPLGSSSGLGTSARGYAAALRAAGVPTVEIDTSWLINPQRAPAIFSPEDLPYSINVFCMNADQIIYFALRYGLEVFQGRANASISVWELPAPRPEWRAILSALDLLILPSQFCTDSFALSTDLPLATIPHVLDAAALVDASRQPTENPAIRHVSAAKAAGKRVVLFVMDASSYTLRKGVDLYCELVDRVEAKRPGEFLFVLKSHSQDQSAAGRERFGSNVFEIAGLMSYPELCALKAMADLYVSPHRSEGFGLNIFESILLGVPVLCSEFGGVVDLLAANEPPLVPVALREVGRDMGPYHAEAIWGEPDLDSFEAAFYAFFKQKERSRRFVALQKRLTTQLSQAAVGAQLVTALTQWCGLGAETAANPLEAFRRLTVKPLRETYILGTVEPSARRSADTPGVERITEVVAGAFRPIFSVITPTFNAEPQWLEEIYDDLLQQTLPSWEWCIVDDGSDRPDTLAKLRSLRTRDSRIKLRIGRRQGGISAATNAAVAIAQGRYLVFLDHDDRIEPTLLQAYHDRTDQGTFDGILYCDEDKLSLSGELCDSYLKPDWSPEHLLSCMYVLHCLCVRKATFLKIGGYCSQYDGAQDHDFLLRAVASHYEIRHVDQVLYHWRMAATSMASTPNAKNPAIETGRKAVAAHLRQIGMRGTVTHGIAPGTYRVRPALPAERVDLNILTGCTPCEGTDGATTFVERFVRSILAMPPAIDFRLRIVTDEPRLHSALPLAALDPRVQVVPFRRSASSFNFAEKANFAVSSSESERVVLLNDDMLAIDADWLPALLEPLEFDGVGVVGGRLLYEDDRIQHCGIVLGVHGAAAHIFEGEVGNFIGYNSFNLVMRNYSAVTGALMAFRRSAFARVGGFDTIFPIDFNDVDFCLKLGQAGLRNVYTPFATLRHFESRSARRFAADPLDRQRFLSRWKHVVDRDPFYNRSLPRHLANCDLAPEWAGRRLPPVFVAGRG